MPVRRKGEAFLRPDDVNDGDVLVITQKPEEVETQWTDRKGNPKMRDRITVLLPIGVEKPVTINATSTNALIDGFGTNEDDWLNRKIIVEKRFQKVRGEDKHVLYFRPHKEAQEQSTLDVQQVVKNMTPEERQQLIETLKETTQSPQ